MPKVINNFFKKKDFKKIKETILSPYFGWYSQIGVTYGKRKKEKEILFCHNFYCDNKVNSQFFSSVIQPFIDRYKISKLIRAKLNLYPQTKKIIKHKFHVDQNYSHQVLLFYFNSNDGKTLFKNKEVKSVENTAVIFDGKTKHASTTCTNKPYRLTLNLNYL